MRLRTGERYREGHAIRRSPAPDRRGTMASDSFHARARTREPPMTRLRIGRLGRHTSALILLASLSASGFAPAPVAAVTYSTSTPMIHQNVQPEDLLANKNGICNGQFQIVIRNALGAANSLRYLDAAQKCGVKAILYFQSTISSGHVYPSRVAPLVRAV